VATFKELEQSMVFISLIAFKRPNKKQTVNVNSNESGVHNSNTQSVEIVVDDHKVVEIPKKNYF
jgi:hypothetical protein